LQRGKEIKKLKILSPTIKNVSSHPSGCRKEVYYDDANAVERC
jgi:hypothetical protein